MNRRKFLLGTSSAAILAAAPAMAWNHGGSFNNNRVTLNVPSTGVGIMNIAKGWFPSFPNPLSPSILNANGYPTATPPNASANIGMVPNYYGQYLWSWSGLGSLQFGGQPAIVYNGGTFAGLAGSTGTVQGNFQILSSAGANPSVTFKFGALVSAVSGGGGSLVTITTNAVNFSSGFATGSQIKFGVGCSANLINGPNSDGSWTITNVSNTQFTLNSSTGVTSPTVTGAGGVGAQTEAVLSVGGGASLAYLNSGATWTISNLVVCQIANQTDIGNGLIWDSVLVNQLRTLMGTPGGVGRGSPGWLRFMDCSAVQGSFECDFSQRLTPASQCWTNPQNTPPAYQAGTITNGGASGSFTDLYSCASNPSNSPSSGPPIDCEVIQGTPNATNSGGKPGITVAGRTSFGNWPIVDASIEPFIFNVSSAPASAGLNLVFTFTASWLNGGVAYPFTYTTVAGDVGNVTTFNLNLVTALIADTTLRAGKIVFTDSARVVAIPPTALSGALTLVYTSGPAIVTICTLVPSTITASSNQCFVFNALLGAFVYIPGFAQSYPLEAIVELCNRVGAHCYYTWPIYTKGAYITAVTNFMASNVTGLTSGLKFGTEVGNEMWNFGAALWGRAQAYGIALGCFVFPYGSNEGPYSWQGLRTVQYANLSIAAWAAASRAASQHYIITPSQTDDVSVNGNFDLDALKGTRLVTSNSNFANFGGIGGTAQGTSLNTAGNRPVDISTATGCAPYWGSPWMAGTASGGNGMAGTVAQNAPLLQAAFNYVNGSPATAFASMVSQFTGGTAFTSATVAQALIGSSGLVYSGFSGGIFELEEALCAQYDSFRTGAGKSPLAIIHYEGGPQWAVGSNINAGVNTPDSTAASITADSTDLSALVTAMTNLGWTTTQLIPYTVSGTGNLTEVATNILQMSQGWKYDTDLSGNPLGTGSYKNMIKTSYYQALVSISGANRETRPAQFGYNQSQWGLWWNTYNSAGAAYQNYNAISEFNA